MRHISACPLVFSVILGVGACVPSVPAVGKLPPGASASRDAAPDPDPAPSPSPSAEAPPFPAFPAQPADPAAAPDGSRSGPADAGAELRGHPDGRADDGDGPSDAAPAAPRARAPRPGEIVIDELLVDPAGDDLGHEWLELANLAGEALDLSALHVSDDTTDVAVDAGVLAAGGLTVLGQSADHAHNGDAPVDHAYGTRLSLNNGADRIAICLGACTGGVTLDAVAWTVAWGAGYVGHAVVVEPGTRATCPAEEPYGTGGNFGSPGRANPPCPGPPEEPSDGGGDGAASDGGVPDGG